MKTKTGKHELKIGDFIVGHSANGEVVVGPVISIDEKKKLAIVGPYQQQSNTAVIDKTVHISEI